MVALVLFSSSSLLHSMAVRLSFSSLSPASSFSHRERSSARLGYRSRPRTPSISSTVWKTQAQRQKLRENGEGEGTQAREGQASTGGGEFQSHRRAQGNPHWWYTGIVLSSFSDEALSLAWVTVCVTQQSPSKKNIIPSWYLSQSVVPPATSIRMFISLAYAPESVTTYNQTASQWVILMKQTQGRKLCTKSNLKVS